MKRYRLTWIAILGILFVALGWPTAARAERFRYSYTAGDKYRILSTVHEDVYIDKILSHHAEILNRIAVTVSSVKNDIGTQEATFQTSENSTQADTSVGARVFQWEREYQSKFDRDALGRYTIGNEYWMPVVRDVPVFPDKDLSVGELWSANGEEVHDFRDDFGIKDPYRIPFVANYRYLGERERKDSSYPTFSVSYRIFDEPAAPSAGSAIWPIRIMGASDQTVYWDRKLGQAVAYEENFRMIFELSNGRTVEYRGTAEAEVVEAPPMDRGRLADEIAGDIARLAIPDAKVRVTDDGVAISLEDIQFRADSSELLEPERAKLDHIGEILKRYGDRDILVAGHTALAKTEEGRLLLSKERAAAVADYLIHKGIRTAEHVVVRGYGATVPIADNTSAEGRKRNRRVEIIILEN